MLTRIKVMLVSVAMVVISLFAIAPAQAAPYCGITWGSLPKVQADRPVGNDFVTNLRTGRHDCYDRMVVDIGNNSDYRGYNVRYVDQFVSEGQGRVLPLRGSGDIAVTVYAEIHDQNGNLTYKRPDWNEVANVSGYTTFRQVVMGGSFEGQTTFGLGVRARLPMRAFVIDDGSHARLVVDVAHKW